jgi:hypothetical protein
MRKNVSLAVYFSCPNCKLVYRAMQVQMVELTNEKRDCVECGYRIHSWTGRYDFLNWKQVTHRR